MRAQCNVMQTMQHCACAALRWQDSAGDRPHDADPAADPVPEACQVVFLVRAVDGVVIETEADEDAVHAEKGLEMPDDRDRAARAQKHRRAAELGPESFGGLGDEGIGLVAL